MSLLKELKNRNIEGPDVSLINLPSIEDSIDLPNLYVKKILKRLQYVLEQYCDGKEVEHETILQFKDRYVFDSSINNLSGERQKDIDAIYKEILEYHNRMKISIRC